jgi:hypothetical protein
MSLLDKIASAAEHIVSTATHTVYQHTDRIDPQEGIYDCDCNGFVEFVLNETAKRHLEMIPKESTQPRPRAFEYFGFFASLPVASHADWKRIEFLKDAQRGDIVAWRFATIEKHVNTGHVVVLAETPKLDAEGDFFAVRVYDSAAEPHFEDTRPSPAGKDGVGSGVINFKVDGDGRAIAYQFAPPATAQYSYRPIAIGRAS